MPKRPNSRRRFLATAGTLLALPWLESWPLGPSARAASPQIPRRFFAYYVPCGIHMASWRPAQQGPLNALPKILAPLAQSEGVDLRPHIEILSGLANLPSRPQGGGDHASGTGGFLTCRTIHKSETEIRAGISADQVYAQHLGDQTILPSLQLGTDGGSNFGGCDSGYGCAYSRNISWSAPDKPLPKLVDPMVAFDFIFAGQDQGKTKEQLMRRKALRQSVLDDVLDQAQSLNIQLSTADRKKVDAYLSSVRDLEKRIEKGGQSSCDMGSWSGEYGSYEQKVDALLDLSVLAMQCDITRVITFMHGNAGSSRSHDFLGAPESHHDLSHHGQDPEKFRKLELINTWEVAKLGRLLAKMSKVQEGDATLLDNSLVFFSSEVSDGNRHNHDDLPILVAGHAGGDFVGGRHRSFDGAPVSELMISMLGLLGVSVQNFGDDGTKPLAGF